MRLKVKRGTAAQAADATLYRNEIFIAEDTPGIYANIAGSNTSLGGSGDGATGPQGATGAQGADGATGPQGASIGATATLTELGLTADGFTGATAMAGLTGGATLQALFDAIASDIAGV